MTSEEADRIRAIRRRVWAIWTAGVLCIVAVALIVRVATGSAGWALATVLLLGVAVMIVWLAVMIARPNIRRPVFRIYAQIFRNRYK